MKRLVFLLLVFLLVFLVGNVNSADLKGKFGITGKGGVVMPFGDFGGDFDEPNKLGAKTGFGFGVTGEYFLSDNISLGAGFLYDIHGVDVGVSGVDINWKISNYEAFFKYLFTTSSKALPYLKFDIGFYQPKLSISGDGSEISGTFSTKLGIAGGAGLAYQVSPSVLLSGELMFHNAFTSDAEYQDVKLDADIQYMSIFAGVTFLVGGTK
ncbi:MAG: outer membrane beta-barrel protein [Candidatus Zixiibacteriota bacterium]